MHILICNDDGYFSEGIQCLQQELIAAGYRVSMVAPDRDNSACGMSITLRQPVTVRQLEKAGAYAVSGTPVDCVGIGISSSLLSSGDDNLGAVDIVVSGINNGANLGDDVLYSGTAAAAAEARRLALPNIALSMTERQPQHYLTAVKVLFEILPKLSSYPNSDEIGLLNINVPDLPFEQLKGIKVTALGVRTSPLPPREEVSAKGVQFMWMGPAGEFLPENHDDDVLYDYQAIEQGYASVTPVQVQLINRPFLDAAQRWLDD